MAEGTKKNNQSIAMEAPSTINTTKGGPADVTIQPSPRISYTDLYTSLTGDKYVDKDKIAEEEKKFKRNKLIASIGDGISALANLFFTTRGAPNMYNHKNSAAQKIQSNWDKWKADTDAGNQAYIAGLMNARKMDDDYNDKERNWQHTINIFNRQQDWRDQDVEYRDKQAQQQQQNWQQTFDETQRHNRAAEAVSYARATGGSGSGSKSTKEKYIRINNGDKGIFSIPQSVWNGSWEQAYNQLVADIENAQKCKKHTSVKIPNIDASTKDKEFFLKRYWGISSRVEKMFEKWETYSLYATGGL